MNKLIIALAIMVVGLTALTYFAISSSALKVEATPSAEIINQPRAVPMPRDALSIEPKADTTPAPEVAPVAAPVAPKPWYESLADSIKELAAALTALAGAIMAVVEIFKKLKEQKEQKAPPATT